MTERTMPTQEDLPRPTDWIVEDLKFEEFVRKKKKEILGVAKEYGNELTKDLFEEPSANASPPSKQS